MKRARLRCLVVLGLFLTLILPCTPQQVSDDNDAKHVSGRGGGAEEVGAAVDFAEEGKRHEGGGGVGGGGEAPSSVALDEEEDTFTDDGGGDGGGGGGASDGGGVLMSADDGGGGAGGVEKRTTTIRTEDSEERGKSDDGGGGDPEAGAQQFDPQNIIICAFFMGNPQGAHLEQLSQMFHSARFVHGPRSRLMVVTDEKSQFQVDRIHKDLEITRFTINEEKFKYHIGGAKSKNHLSLMPKRVAFESFLLEKLHKEGNKTNVVFVDTDLLFLRSVSDIFSNNDFDVAMTFRKPIPGRAHTSFLARQEPVNLGIKFANGNGLAVAFAFWQKSLEIWDKSSYAKCNDCDQQAFSDAGKLASSDKRLRNKHPFVNEVSTDAGMARVRYVHCSYFNSYPSKGNCGPSSFSHVLHFKGDLKRWMPKVYGMMKGEVLAAVDPDAKVSATHSVAQHTVKTAANAYASFYRSSQNNSKRKKRGL